METITSDQELIRNAIANVAISFDMNTFERLRDSFTKDCVADYTGSLGLMNGVDTVIQQLQKTIGHVSTFHSLSTQVIRLTGNDTAEATTYVSASHFADDKSFFAEARYLDKLVKVTEGGNMKWLIDYRLTTMMGVPRGDVSIFNMNLEGWVDTLKA
ncbi:putative small subunit of phenylpropionate dioxygenase protein [Botrytis fragariae]|uniref:Putative small subunit of phenylpropionate dioxygenase protein n=1 Tax=Botrytis fragariae TaxID=1964551 RepID=A0A8H6AIZ9_9HELO|nr:putative small subunit of phenylpropionate dioxygenase protein [Botrytis fragariae]KAF5868257.1 putative small subunit of phenylpropionate dioxygenase protein [Botrytis fragariae]